MLSCLILQYKALPAVRMIPVSRISAAYGASAAGPLSVLHRILVSCEGKEFFYIFFEADDPQIIAFFN